jgi:RNA polymerase sigma factor (sigma-70 family)
MVTGARPGATRARAGRTQGRSDAERDYDEGRGHVVDDETRFSRIVEENKATVYRLAYSFMRSGFDADDVTQAVFVRLYRDGRWRSGAERAFEGDEHLRSWLVRVTINECRSLFRRLRRAPEGLEGIADTLAGRDRSQDGAQQASDVLDAVMRLPEKYRVPIYLRYYEGYSAKEVAGLLGVPEATVRTRLARARERLGRALAPSADEEGSGEPGAHARTARRRVVPARAAPPRVDTMTTGAMPAMGAGTTTCEGRVGR